MQRLFVSLCNVKTIAVRRFDVPNIIIKVTYLVSRCEYKLVCGK